MVFLCQKNSFLKEYESKVVSCKRNDTGVPSNTSLYHVKMEDTIFFPEGGGQHCDKGTLGGVEVLDVFRDGDEAIHVVGKEFQVGQLLQMKLNWTHRLDQMQQHSGQHLLSAVIDKTLAYETTGWDCGTDECKVELDTKNKDLTEDQLVQLEEMCNDKIREGVPVSVSVYKPGDKELSEGDKRGLPKNHQEEIRVVHVEGLVNNNSMCCGTHVEILSQLQSIKLLKTSKAARGDPELSQAHTRGLPKDHQGLIRIVNIEGLDQNMCCGTHVDNLSRLQTLKLLRTSKAQKGKILLHFVVGNRVLQKLKETYNREREMSSLIKCNPENQLELVRKNIELSRKQNKYLQSLLKDVATLEAKAIDIASPYTFIYKREGDMSYANCFCREFQKRGFPADALLVIITGDTQDGNLLMYRKSGNLDPIGALLCETGVLDGIGKGRDAQYSAKLKRPERHVKANEAVQKYLKTNAEKTS